MHQDLTGVLQDVTRGDESAAEILFRAAYDDLRSRAQSYLARERDDHTLQATALVHEAYLRLIDQTGASWNDRNHFFAVASRVMRRILVDHARARRRVKRGGGRQRVSLDQVVLVSSDIANTDLIALDAALLRLQAERPELAHVVELRFFGGMSYDEIANVTGLSERTARRHWSYAKARLYELLAGDDPPAES